MPFVGVSVPREVPIAFVASAAVALSITDAQVSLSPAHDIKISLAGYTRFRLIEGHTSGTDTGTKYGCQYTLDLTGATGWTWLDGTAGASAPTAYVDITTASVLNEAGPFTIVSAARTMVRLRARFLDGNNTSYNLRTVQVVVS